MPDRRASGDNIERHGSFYRRSDARHIPREALSPAMTHEVMACF